MVAMRISTKQVLSSKTSYNPGKRDYMTYEIIKNKFPIDSLKYTHLDRWIKYIESFTQKQRQEWK